jgi:hypothetical protein
MVFPNVPVVHCHAEATREGDQNFLELVVGMASSNGINRDVVYVVNAGDFERDGPTALDGRQISAWIVDLREID